MDKDLDALLGAPLLAPPDDFGERVMRRIGRLPPPARRSGGLAKLGELALLAGGIAGAAQLAAFMFGIWAAASAG
ncbi:hypothetical protein [Janthinobacterium fluminis]|uniref:Uncharacterized protein n=1 Tax=Janthinobacterium fluminis TaxID=2987524 RepID=A0ABT5K082_9BURK|nr:hypothetical protein [Janthinobacterium fluminis]MDC8758372.1 hypothetical protein [Janthinobacterium fluminis]